MPAIVEFISFKNVAPNAVAAVISKQMPKLRCFVSLYSGRWACAYPEPSQQDGDCDTILALGSNVCSALRCSGVAFQVTLSDTLSWWVFDCDVTIAGSSNAFAPENRGSEKAMLGLAGDPATIAALGGDRQVTSDQVLRILSASRRGSMHQSSLELVVDHISELLGIKNSSFGYTDVVEMNDAVPGCVIVLSPHP
jgi:hypothetical protein